MTTETVTGRGTRIAQSILVWVFAAFCTTSVFADCEISPETLDFGDVPVGESRTLSFLFENTGTDTLTGDLSEDCEEYRILSPEPYDLEPGQSRLVELEFSPITAGETDCTIDMGHPDCESVSAIGVGTLAPECEVSPTSGLDFGELEVGEEGSLELLLRNVGGGLLVGEVTVECVEFRIDGAADYALGPNESQVISVRYAPIDEGEDLCLIDTGSPHCENVQVVGSGFILPVCQTEAVPPDFGDVIVGESSEGEIRLENIGGGLLEGTLTIDCDGFSLVDTEGHYELGPSESVTFVTRFVPTEIRLYECSALSENCEISFQGQGIGVAVCEVNPELLEFGTVEVGTAVERSFTISNSGTAAMSGTVTESCGPFTIVGEASYLIEPGGSWDITVRFAPEASGTQACAIDPGSPLCPSVQAEGTGFRQPECRVSVSELEFGAVSVGNSVTRIFEIENVGGGRLQGSVLINCEHFELEDTEEDVGEYDLGALEEQVFTVRYSPGEEGSHSCTIDTGSGCSAIDASGSGTVDPICSVEPASLDFGDVPPGESEFRTLTIRNDGGGEIQGEFTSDCSEFSFVGETTYKLSAGESHELNVRFSSEIAGVFVCTITSSDDGCGSVTTTAAVEAPPACDLSSLLLDFGTIMVGEVADRELTVTNRGGGVLEGTLSTNCESFLIVDTDPNYALESNASQTFTLRFVPTEVGLSTCELGTGDGCSDVQLRGLGSEPPAPVCELSRTEVRFGRTQLGEAVTSTLTIRNVGEGLLEGTATLDCSGFSLQGERSYALAAEETHEIEITFIPTTVGVAQCQIDVGPDCVPVDVIGEGVDIRDCLIEPALFEFGAVDIGTQTEETFTITNVGAATISGAVMIEGPCEDVFIVGPSGYSLPPGEGQTFRIRFEPTSAGLRSCSIETGAEACFDIPLSATGVLSPFCEVSTRFLNLGTVEVGQVSDQTFRIANTGGGVLSGELGMSCPDWSLLDSAQYEIPAGGDRVFTVRFAPTTSGPANCEIQLGSDRCGSITAIATAEPVPAPACSFSPQLIDFGASQIGTGISETILLQNVGNADLTGVLTTDCLQFRVVEDTEVQLAPGEQRTIEIRFVPNVVGPVECRLLLEGCGEIGVTLRGRGEVASPPRCELSTTDLDFGGVPLDGVSTQQVIIQNVGGGRLEGTIHIGCSDFEILGSDVYSLGPDEWHAVEIQFQPTGRSEESCLLDIDEDACGPVTLRGHGVSSSLAICSLRPESIDFGHVDLGGEVERELEITNDGAGVLVGILSLDARDVTVIGDAKILLGEGETQIFTLRYQPTTVGTLSGEVRISESCVPVVLSGNSIPEEIPHCRIEPRVLDFGVVLSEQRRVLPITIYNDGGGVLSGRVEINCPGYRVLGAGDYELTEGESITLDIEYTAGSEIVDERCQIEVRDCVIDARATVARSEIEITVDRGSFLPFGFGVTVSDAGALLGSLGQLGTDYELWRWSESDLAYLRWSTLPTPAAVSFQTADGFWLESKNEPILGWSGDPILESRMHYPLTSGCTQFSSFFQVPIAVSQLRVSDGLREVPVVSDENTLTEPVIWRWNGIEHVPATTVQPFESYWIRTRSSLSNPGGVSGIELIFDRTIEAESSTLSLPDWEFRIAASQALAEPVHVSIGAATDEDRLSWHAVPSPPFETLQLGVQGSDLENPDLNAPPVLYNSLYRPESRVMVFDLILAGLKANESVTLEFDGENLPNGVTFVLTHWDQRLTRSVSAGGSVRLEPIADKDELQFRMVASFAGADSIPPESEPPEIAETHYPIAQPNPFYSDTELRFVLLEPGELTIEVFDPHGRRVRRLYRTGLPAGEVSIVWDGLDDHGNRVQSGVYLTRFSAGGETRTMRVVRVG